MNNTYGDSIPMGCSLSVGEEEKPYDDIMCITKDQAIPTKSCSAYAAGKDAGPSAALNPDMRTAYPSDEHIYDVLP